MPVRCSKLAAMIDQTLLPAIKLTSVRIDVILRDGRALDIDGNVEETRSQVTAMSAGVQSAPPAVKYA
jgi:hypothetical protein